MKLILKHTDLEKILPVLNDRHDFLIIEKTGYSTTVKTPCNRSYFFSEKLGGGELFRAANAIKKDVKNSGQEILNPDAKRVKYYEFNKLGITPNCYCVDINAAYPSILLRDNFISKKTYDNILKIKKINRLRATGMLATRKEIYRVEKNKVVYSEIKESPYRPIFFYLCQQTGEIMAEAKKIDENNFIFFWVDGIFVKKNPDKYVELFKKFGVDSKIEKVEGLRISSKGNYLFFKKEGVKKTQPIPINKKRVESEQILNWLKK